MQGEFNRVRLAAVVEARLAVYPEPHCAAHHPEHPDDAVPIGRDLPGNRHEVHYLTDPVGTDEPGDQDRRTGQVELFAHVFHVAGRNLEVSAFLPVDQTAENAWRIKPGRTEPVKRAVPGDQRRRLQITDQPVVLDCRIRLHYPDLPVQAPGHIPALMATIHHPPARRSLAHGVRPLPARHLTVTAETLAAIEQQPAAATTPWAQAYASSTVAMPASAAKVRRSSTSRARAASAFIAKMCSGEAAMTRSPGWSKTRRRPGSGDPHSHLLDQPDGRCAGNPP